ncbi:Protein hcp1 [Rubrivivax sp. A210]|uniref:Hcp family type VI secretion system effector n=1 Tax=Rubrivivax sp. A210 TaxID=2772301 RepID=UPI00191B0373|nr:type VI secretion system tube protein Hcp [Rubrivivax sp. A210]CAD5369320.1 Protein hcp1 [Rubrivivax sp. A210]
MAIKGAYGQEDFLLYLEGIKGESRNIKFPEQIEVESWSFGLSQTGSFGYGGAGGGAGKVQFKELSFVTKMCAASPKLQTACVTGQHIPKAILTCCKAGGSQQFPFYTVTLTDVLVSGYTIKAEGETVLPQDFVTLSFAKIEVAYSTQSAGGNMGAAIKAGWDLNRNAPV